MKSSKDFTYTIGTLSSRFYLDYPSFSFPEILGKETRPYDVIIFETKEDYYVCVPFRTYLNHKNGFHFYSRPISIRNNPGIDYSKMVIINNNDYIGHSVIIDSKQMTIF